MHNPQNPDDTADLPAPVEADVDEAPAPHDAALPDDPDYNLIPVQQGAYPSDECIDWNNMSVVHPDDLEPGSILLEMDYHSLVQPRLKSVLAWRRTGATNDQVAHNLGITTRALNQYLKLFPEFRKVMSFGKLDAIAQVTNMAFLRASGYEKTVKRQKVVQGQVVEYEDTFYIQPDTSMIQFILERQGGWTSKSNVTLDGQLQVGLAALMQDIGKAQQSERQKELEPPE